MMRHLAKSCLGCLALALAWLPAAKATVVVDLQLEDLAKVSEVVVVGEVNQITSAWNQDHTRIYTTVVVTPSEVLRGPASNSPVTIKTIGGTVDNITSELAGAPRFEVGEKVLVFLEPRKDGDGYLTVGFYMGKFKVYKDPVLGKELLQRDAPAKGVTVVNPKHPQFIEPVRSLDEVRALVKK